METDRWRKTQIWGSANWDGIRSACTIHHTDTVQRERAGTPRCKLTISSLHPPTFPGFMILAPKSKVTVLFLNAV